MDQINWDEGSKLLENSQSSKDPNKRQIFAQINVDITGVTSYSKQCILKVESLDDFQRQGK